MARAYGSSATLLVSVSGLANMWIAGEYAQAYFNAGDGAYDGGTQWHATIMLGTDGEVYTCGHYAGYFFGNIDLQHHGATEIQHILDQSAPDQCVREEWASEYQRALLIGEQLDTILNAFSQLRLDGTGLPKEMGELLGKWLAVKRGHPKPDPLEDEDAGSGA